MNGRRWIGVLCLLALSRAADATKLNIQRDALVRGVETSLRVVPDSEEVVTWERIVDGVESSAAPHPASGWTVVVTYFPNSKVARNETLGVTGDGGVVTWTPEFAGIVTVDASRPSLGDDASVRTLSENVSVRYPGVPGGAVLVFILAGTILLGGAGWSLIHLAEHEPEDGGEEN